MTFSEIPIYKIKINQKFKYIQISISQVCHVAIIMSKDKDFGNQNKKKTQAAR